MLMDYVQKQHEELLAKVKNVTEIETSLSTPFQKTSRDHFLEIKKTQKFLTRLSE